MKVDLSEDEFVVLFELVRRLRPGPGGSPRDGVDWRLHGRVPHRDRRCGAQVRRLTDLRLVVLPAGDPAARWWLYRTTPLGRTVLGIVYLRWEREP